MKKRHLLIAILTTATILTTQATHTHPTTLLTTITHNP